MQKPEQNVTSEDALRGQRFPCVSDSAGIEDVAGLIPSIFGMDARSGAARQRLSNSGSASWAKRNPPEYAHQPSSRVVGADGGAVSKRKEAKAMAPTSKPSGLPVLIFAPNVWDRMSYTQRRRMIEIAPAVFLKKSPEEAPTGDSDAARRAAEAVAELGYWLVPAPLSK